MTSQLTNNRLALELSICLNLHPHSLITSTDLAEDQIPAGPSNYFNSSRSICSCSVKVCDIWLHFKSLQQQNDSQLYLKCFV